MISQRHNKPWNSPDDPMFDDSLVQQRMAFIDQVNCGNTQDDEDVTNCQKLNAAPTPYFDGGIHRVNRTGEWNYMCTRNNNFSNRSQKAYMTSEDTFPTWAVVAIVGGVGVIGIGAIAGGIALYAKSHSAAAVAVI